MIKALDLPYCSEPHQTQDHKPNAPLPRPLLDPSRVFCNRDNGLKVKLEDEGWKGKFCGLSTCLNHWSKLKMTCQR